MASLFLKKEIDKECIIVIFNAVVIKTGNVSLQQLQYLCVV